VSGYIPSDDIVDWVYLEQEDEAQKLGYSAWFKIVALSPRRQFFAFTTEDKLTLFAAPWPQALFSQKFS
jgi:hypothetical protein